MDEMPKGEGLAGRVPMDEDEDYDPVAYDEAEDEEDELEDTEPEDLDDDPGADGEDTPPREAPDDPDLVLSEEELDEIADIAIEVIRNLLGYFDAEEAEIEEYEGDEMELIFDVVGDNLAMLIGRHGRTLEAMQYLVSAIVNKRIGRHYPVVVDVEGYVNRRKQKIVSIAKSSAARAIRQKRSVKLRPMSPYERRIVHMTLKSDNRVRTESEGVDPNRQVVIYPN